MSGTVRQGPRKLEICGKPVQQCPDNSDTICVTLLPGVTIRDPLNSRRVTIWGNIMGNTALTDSKIQGLKPPASGRIEVADEKVQGLRVRVSSKGSKTFIVRKRQGEKVHNVTIGKYGPRLGLAEARRKARTLLNDLEAGKGVPKRKRRSQGARGTFRALIPDYLASKTHLRSHREIERILKGYVLPEFGDRMADTITRGEVTELIDQIADTAPTMARAVHAQLSAF